MITMSKKVFFVSVFGLLALQALVLWVFGQPLTAADGTVKFWEGVVQSSGNSQHLSDWYTFSHIIHGFIFYAFLWWLFPRSSIAQRLLFAMMIEIGWEILENTPMVINAYREQALAQGYSGDSVINSLSDTFAMMFGFLVAWRLPVAATIGIVLFFEVWVGWSIRDNLSLNILNFAHHFEFIERWQSGN
jgi:hypothetical protein